MYPTKTPRSKYVIAPDKSGQAGIIKAGGENHRPLPLYGAGILNTKAPNHIKAVWTNKVKFLKIGETRFKGYLRMRLINFLCIILILFVVLFNGCREGTGGTIDAKVDIDKCPVHETPLKEDSVRILYGLPSSTEEYRAAQRELFPYANTDYVGGCAVRPEWYAKVKCCSNCRQAKKEWEKIHGRRGIK